MATYYDLYIQCPACIADNGYDPNPPAQWYHTNCEGKRQIADNAYFQCVSCNHSSHIKNWRYACAQHKSDFRPTTAAHFANSIAIAGQVVGKAGRQWLVTLLQNLGDDW